MAVVYLGIGSNIGDREANCLRAIEVISEAGLIITKRSALFETEPWGVKDQPEFINMAVELETVLSPSGLLVLLKDIEKEMGRELVKRWGPRIIDLDILLYDDIRIKEEGLEIPHPLMHVRDFVLKPLSEIAPDMVHPVSGKKISELLSLLTDQT